MTMVGGPKDGQSFWYPNPLPNVVTFQSFNGGWHNDDYRRRPNTLYYDHVTQ